VIGWYAHAALQLAADPTIASIVHATPSVHVVGQLPSQVSPISRAELPHVGEQSESLFALQAAAQHPSPSTHWLMGWNEHAALHVVAEPTSESIVHAFPSVQAVGHDAPSQVSPSDTTPSPHDGEQSLSVASVQPARQQPSPPLHATIGWKLHALLQLDADPTSVSAVQALPSLHVAGQLPSHVSFTSTTPFPHDTEQSRSVTGVQPSAQHPSPSLHSTIGSNSHAELHVARSDVHATPSVHIVGQFPSHASSRSMTPSPHVSGEGPS
jgi:hypothetical protein